MRFAPRQGQPHLSMRTLLRRALGCALSAVAAAQSPQQYALRVNGSPVVTARPAARVAGEWFVPLAPVARALGADLNIDPKSQSIRVLRSDGATASYDGATGRILQGSVLAGEVRNFRQVQLNVGAENLLFPVSGVVALLAVTVREDPDHDVLEIESVPPSTGGRGGGPFFQVASLDDKYGLSTNGLVWQQWVSLRGQALPGGDRMTANLELNRIEGGAFLGFRQGSLRMETARQRVIVAGDQGTYIGVEALSNAVRGLGYEWRWRQFVVDVYGGRAASSTSSALGSAGRARYDATISGFGLRRKSKTSDFSLAGNLFRGERRSGVTFGAGYSGVCARNEFKVQGLLGDFSGFSLRPVLRSVDSVSATQASSDLPALQMRGNIEGKPLATTPSGSIVEVEEETEHVKGPAYGFSLADTFRPLTNNKLWLTGLWERYSRNFLIVREESRFSAVSRRSVSAVVQPDRHISLTGGVRNNTALLGGPELERGYTYGINAAAPGRVSIQFGYFRSIQMNGGRFASRFDLSQYSLQLPRLDRYSASAIYSEIRFNGQLARAMTETFSADFARIGRLGFHDQLQLQSSHNYGVDWSRQFGREGAYFLAGLERQTMLRQRAILAPVAALRLPLPRGQGLTLSYIGLRGSRLLQLELGGPILRRRELVQVNAQTALIVQCSLTGQVYHDVDLDGRFQAGVDRPVPQLQVWLDEEGSTTTDSEGYYRFNGVGPGTHRVRAAIATLPANLIFANEDLMVAVMPYRANRQDFRAIPTGRVQGRVIVVRMDETGREVEQPFPDVRVLATGDRDTFSERDGVFVLGDLPPGIYQLRLDPATVPAGLVVRPAMQTMELKPGQTANAADFHLERPVIIKPAPPSPPQPGRQGACSSLQNAVTVFVG